MIKARSIIELVGGPKEYVDKMMGVVVDKLKEDKHVALKNHKVFDAKPMQGQEPLFSAFCEAEIEAKEMDDLFGFCFDFMPSSVEIYDPTQMIMKADAINDMFNELIGKLHQYDLAFKNIAAQNILLKRKYEGGARLEEKNDDKKDKKK